MASNFDMNFYFCNKLKRSVAIFSFTKKHHFNYDFHQTVSWLAVINMSCAFVCSRN